MARPLALIGFVCLSFGLGSCTKADPPPKPDPVVAEAPAAPRRTEASLDFLAVLDASQTTVVHIGDPYRHARRLLDSEPMRRLFASPAFAPMAAATSLDEMVGKVESARDVIPEALVLATDAALMDDVMKFNRLMTVATLCQSASTIGASKELAERQVQLAEELEAVRVPHVTVWAQFSTEKAAANAFTLGLQASLAAPESLQIERADEKITASLLHDAPTASAFVLPTLVQFGVLADVDDPIGVRMVDAVVALDLSLTLTRRGDALVVELGPAPESREPVEIADLGSHFDPKDADQVVWAQWDFSSAKTEADASVEMLEASKKTKAGQHFVATNPLGLVDDVYDLQRTFASMSPAGTMRITGSDALSFDAWESGLPRGAALESTDLAPLVPPDSALFLLTSTYGVGDALAETLAKAEDRLATKNLQAVVSDNETLEGLTDAISDTYYGEFRALRKKVLAEGPKQFEPGFGIIVGPAELSGAVTIRGIDALARADQMPVPAVAMIGKPKSAPSAEAWLEDVVQEVAASSLAATGHRRPAKLSVAEDADLGLGVPTRAFTLSWLGEAVPQFSSEATDGTGLHVFEHDGLLVVSTSVALSKAILDPDRAQVSVDDAVTFGRGHGDRLGRVITDLGEVIGSPTASSVTAMLGAVVQTAGDLSWTARQEGEIRHSRFTIDFGTAPEG